MTEFDDFFCDGFDDLLITMGEQVVYWPRCGKCRTITVIVDREPGEVYINGEIVAPKLVIRAHNNCADGIDHNEIDNGDQVEVSIRPRSEKTMQTFQRVEGSDGGVTEIAVT